jgi:hypothetical protein
MAVRAEETEVGADGGAAPALLRFGSVFAEVGDQSMSALAADCRAVGLESLLLEGLRIGRQPQPTGPTRQLP